MGWGRTLLLGDIGNRLDIEDVERDLRSMRREVESKFRTDISQDEAIQTLLEENGQLKLYLAALLRLLTQKGTISHQELTAIVTTIDAEDGSADGKYEGKIL